MTVVPFKTLVRLDGDLRQVSWRSNGSVDFTVRESLPWGLVEITPLYVDWFNLAVSLIYGCGHQMVVGGQPFRFVDINGYQYGVSGLGVDRIIRRPVPCYAEYDKIADQYDGMFSDDGSLKENKEVIERLGLTPAELVLDIGCGTGLLVDVTGIGPVRYSGIDPSARMLSRFLEKHPFHQTTRTKFESFVPKMESETGNLVKYSAIVSLFGSPAYVMPESWSRLSEILDSGGRYFLMFYKAGYTPTTWKSGKLSGGFFVDEWRGHLPFVESVEEYHNYVIVQGRKP